MKKIFLLALILCCAQGSTSLAFAKAWQTKKSKIPPISVEGGYVGTLPDVEERFQKSKPKMSVPMFDSVDGFNDQNQLKPVPRDNPAFVNIILKRDKTSQYLNDINYIIPMVEKIEQCIEDGQNIQKFSAASYYLKENVEYLRDKYENKSESSYISFRKLMQLNLHIQTISQLRTEGEIYSPYLAYTDKGYIFSPNNIDKQLSYLLKEIQDTLIVLKEAN